MAVIKVDFQDCVWLPGTPWTAASSACFFAIYAIGAICSAVVSEPGLLLWIGGCILSSIVFLLPATLILEQGEARGKSSASMLLHTSKLKQ